MIGLIGNLLAKAFKMMGLGWLDRTRRRGLSVFFKGWCWSWCVILVIVAFFPQEQWLAESTCRDMFFGALHVSTHMTPSELVGPRPIRVCDLVEEESQRLLHIRQTDAGFFHRACKRVMMTI